MVELTQQVWSTWGKSCRNKRWMSLGCLSQAEFPLQHGSLGSSCKAVQFTEVDNPGYQGQFSLLKVNWLWTSTTLKISSQQYLD